MEIARLQFITQKKKKEDILEEAEAFLKGGGRWIQLRMKNAPEEETEEAGHAVRALCDRYGAIYIMNDSIELAVKTGADGVHLGKNDGSTADARLILGNKIIGRTCHTFEDIIKYAGEGADYMGLGALRATATKADIAGELGFDGYRRIFERLKGMAGIPPIVAIGGIKESDIKQLRETGLYGIAVSGLIGNSHDPAEITRKIFSLL